MIVIRLQRDIPFFVMFLQVDAKLLFRVTHAVAKEIIWNNQLTLKCTAPSAWMHCKEKTQKNQLAVDCTTRRSKLLKFISGNKVYVTFW